MPSDIDTQNQLDALVDHEVNLVCNGAETGRRQHISGVLQKVNGEYWVRDAIDLALDTPGLCIPLNSILSISPSRGDGVLPGIVTSICP